MFSHVTGSGSLKQSDICKKIQIFHNSIGLFSLLREKYITRLKLLGVSKNEGGVRGEGEADGREYTRQCAPRDNERLKSTQELKVKTGRTAECIMSRRRSL